MASRFDDIFGDTALPAMFEVHGDAGRFEYTPAGSTDSQAMDAIIGQERVERDVEQTGLVLGYSRWVTVLASSLAAPKTNATATVDDVEYAVRSIKQGVDNWRLELFRTTVQEFSRAGYRRGR
jgi:hypothetical protein